MHHDHKLVISVETSTVRTAVIGTGYLGKFHAEKYALLPGSHLVGIADPDLENAEAIAVKLDVPVYTDYRELLGVVDALSIAAPTTVHFELAETCLLSGVHVLVEKPITVTTAEADTLVEIARRNKCILQVGHIQRFHPALLGLDALLNRPTFIETHRLAPFRPRGTDVNVVLDLMIHDIDIVLNLVGSEVVNIAASGTCVLSDSIDIANVRLNFADGCVANITASRVSRKTERKMRIFQQNQCLSVDLYNHRLDKYFRSDNPDHQQTPKIESSTTEYENNDALQVQIESFLDCVRFGRRPLVSGEDGRRALATAMEITRMIDNSEPSRA